MIKRKRKFEEHESSRERLCRLVDEGKVTLEDALLACIQMMSEDDCESVICNLAEQALEQCNDEKCAEEEDLPSDDVEDENTDEDPDESTDEGCRRRELEARIRRIESLLKRNKHTTNEDWDDSLRDAVEDWYWDHCTPDDFDDREDWVETIKALATFDDDITVDMCVEAVADEDSRDEVASILADLAQKEDLDDEGDEWGDDEDNDDWDEDEYDESLKRHHRRHTESKHVIRTRRK